MTAQTVLMPKSVQLATGVTLPYVVQGDPDGIPVILLHGATDSWRSFQLLMQYLPLEWRTFAVTQRGHGDADRPAHGYGPSDFVADVASFQDALRLDTAVIVGHSLGSIVGQRFAFAYPERTSALVLMATFRNWRDSPEVAEFLEQVVVPLVDPVDPAIAQDFQESTLAQPIPDWYLEAVVQESLKVPARVWREVFTSFAAADYESGLDRLAVPTLILWGEQDAYSSRADQEFIAQTIPGAKLIVYPNGHAIHWEDPRRAANDLIDFIAGLRA